VWRLAAVAVWALLLVAAPCRAADFHVANANALQSALTTAAGNGADDVIYVAAGNYLGNFNFNSAQAHDLTLRGEPGTTNTAITFDGAATGRDVNLTSAGNVTVRGLTFLRNCGDIGRGALRIAANGGSILVDSCYFLSATNSAGMGLEIAAGVSVIVTNCAVNGNTNSSASTGISMAGFSGEVTVQNCSVTTNLSAGLLISLSSGNVNLLDNVFAGNQGGWGGASLRTDGSSMITLTGNTFSGNSGYYNGGVNCGSPATFADNTFSGNSGAYVGGVNCGSPATFAGNTFSGNSGSWYGGAVLCNASGTLSGNTFSNNFTSSGDGGGVTCSGPAVLSGNTFSNNSSGANGGGVYCGSDATLTGNKFTENTAGAGGGLYLTGPTFTLLDNLVVNNSQTSASDNGGGIWVNASATLDMINNTVVGNTSAAGGGVAFHVSGLVEVLNVYNNIIISNSASGYGGDVWMGGTGQMKSFVNNDAHDMFGIWDIVENLLDVDPEFVDPAHGDYHLRNTSLCVNAGTNGAPALPATDLDGSPRIAGGTVDLGAYEFGANLEFFRITAVERAGGGIKITWETLGGTTNVVQFTPGAADGSYSNNFTDLSLPIIIPGTGLVTTNYPDSNGATNRSRFYRIRMTYP
jgi:predicted outer membrane repeat protein